mgnify:CR=1 FL=1
MARYIWPKLKIIRRIGKLRGLTRKKPFRRVYRGRGPLRGKVIPPGQHGLIKLFKTRPYDSCESDYLIRLKVKQRLRYNYGLTERQLVNYVRKAKKIKEATGQVLLQLLEMRLDNIVFRLGIAPTRQAARQLVSHRHIKLNGRVTNVPSARVRPGDIVSVREKSKAMEAITDSIAAPKSSKVAWLEWDNDQMAGKLINIPEREDIPETIQEQLIVELYSK